MLRDIPIVGLWAAGNRKLISLSECYSEEGKGLMVGVVFFVKRNFDCFLLLQIGINLM